MGSTKHETEGTAKRKVKTAAKGDGIEAMYRLMKWFQQVTGLGMNEKRTRIMRP